MESRASSSVVALGKTSLGQVVLLVEQWATLGARRYPGQTGVRTFE